MTKQDPAKVAVEELADCHWIDSSDEAKAWTEKIIREAYVEQSAELEAIREAVVKMSHRKCWVCKHVGYYLLPVTPYVRCEKCGSQDTRLIKQAEGGAS